MNKYLFLFSCVLVGCGTHPGNEAFSNEEVSTQTQALSESARSDLIAAKRRLERWLGDAQSGVSQYSNGAGRRYANGRIFVGDAVGEAHSIHNGRLLDKYISWGRSAAGYPILDDYPTGAQTGWWLYLSKGGTIMHKDGASKAYALEGCIAHSYSWIGSETSPLGYPTSDQSSIKVQTGAIRRVSRFEGGSMYEVPDSNESCQGAAYPVITSPSAAAPPAGAPVITYGQVDPNALGVTLSVYGANFTPGTRIQAAVTSPLYATAFGFTDVKADGTFQIRNKAVEGGAVRAIDDHVTFYVFASDGLLSAKRIRAEGHIGECVVPNCECGDANDDCTL